MQIPRQLLRVRNITSVNAYSKCAKWYVYVYDYYTLQVDWGVGAVVSLLGCMRVHCVGCT